MKAPVCALRTIYVNRSAQVQVGGEIHKHDEIMDVRCEVISLPVTEQPEGVLGQDVLTTRRNSTLVYTVSVTLTKEELALLDELTKRIEDRVEEAFRKAANGQ